MICYAKNTLTEYLELLSAREPVPGGGSAAALSGSLGAALLVMVGRYAVGKGKPEAIDRELIRIVDQASQLRARLLDLVTRDSQAFLNMREAKKVGEDAYRKAGVLAADVPREVMTLCEQGLALAPFLRKEGSPYLVSDVVAAEAFFQAGTKAAQAMIEANA